MATFHIPVNAYYAAQTLTLHVTRGAASLGSAAATVADASGISVASATVDLSAAGAGEATVSLAAADGDLVLSQSVTLDASGEVLAEALASDVPTTAQIEAALIDEQDGQALRQALLDKINADLDLPALELAAIASEVTSSMDANSNKLAAIETQATAAASSAGATEAKLPSDNIAGVADVASGGGEGPFVQDRAARSLSVRVFVKKDGGLVADRSIEISVGDGAAPLASVDFSRDLRVNQRVAQIVSIEQASGPEGGLTLTPVGVDRGEAKYTPAAGVAGEYAARLRVRYTDSGGERTVLLPIDAVD